ncbi:PLDc N-terminal domain-containing protein [Bogoriella caseilytica]|uniref:Phospholipase D-like protein n=1 Tax=Bogoriella caseilytica TaxID=56055 RepID=A0A3N2BDS5_9MICO|nr:PLDc N-terminal domain-containing protein [Bogoriella caseilytica]ROR73396.1 phospholipase D-like protein [Bogoriella caseilytica]
MFGEPLALIGAAIGLSLIVLFFAAVVSIMNSRSYTAGLKALWILGVLAFPLLGPLVWFFVGKNSHG